MAEIFNGRYTARTDKPLVLFLIGMRLNKLWAAHKWLPVFAAMPQMLAELDRKPEAGLLSHRLYMSGRIFLLQQYWDSFDKLLAYAHDTSAQHFPAWAAFNRAVGKDGTVGIWHETFSSSRANMKPSMPICRCSVLPPRRAMSARKVGYPPRKTACAGISCRLGREKLGTGQFWNNLGGCQGHEKHICRPPSGPNGRMAPRERAGYK
jgi:hypothetical protein